MQNINQCLHMIGHAHIDPVWLWTWREGYQEIKATFRSALDRMHEFPDFCFTASSAAFYAWIEENNPEMFKEIQERVAEERWELAGGWWVEPDCNTPAGESFVRQALYGQRYFMDKFGKKAKIAFNPDSFGHAGILPQILSKSGLEAYVFMRPGINEKELPSELFIWKSPDGSQIPVYRIVGSYNGDGPDFPIHIQKTIDLISPVSDQMMCFYGVGNHGGGPTITNISHIMQHNQNGQNPPLRMSGMEQFFTSTKDHYKNSPVVTDDLQFHAKGCYSAHSGIKKWNGQAEQALLRSEKLAAIAAISSQREWPREFDHAWKNVLFNQFHDILAGTSLEQAYDDARQTYGEAMAIAARAENSAIQAMSWQINLDGSPEDKFFVVFNPHAWPAEMPVEMEISLTQDQYQLYDSMDQPVSAQLIQPSATANGRKRLIFTADLPSLGYHVYTLRPLRSGLITPIDQPELPPADSDPVIENAYLRLQIDRKTGWIKSMHDKRLEREMLSAPAGQPVIYDDPSDTWSHGIRRYDQEAARIMLPEIRLVESGPVRSVIRVSGSYGHSYLRQDYILYHNLARLDIDVCLDWHEKQKVLKFLIPAAVQTEYVVSETPYSYISRLADGDEWPCQNWIDISDGSAGLGLINTDKYSFSAEGAVMALTAVRSPVYAHHEPAVLDENQEYRYIDQGEQIFKYVLVPHGADWRNSQLLRWSWEINQPPATIAESVHAGTWPLRKSWIDVDQPVVLSVIKRAEDDDGWIMRFYEPYGRPVQTVWQMPGDSDATTLDFQAHEIKTVRWNKSGNLILQSANLID